MQSAAAADEGQGPDPAVRGLIDVNGLSYRMAPGLSVATSRVTREWDALRNVYNQGETVVFAVSSGAAYVDPENSYITFRMRVGMPDNTPVANDDQIENPANLACGYNWGGSLTAAPASSSAPPSVLPEYRQNALNLFESMRLIHSSGYEIDRLQRGFASWHYIKNAMTKDDMWYKGKGALLRGRQVLNGFDQTNLDVTKRFIWDGGNGGVGTRIPGDVKNFVHAFKVLTKEDNTTLPQGRSIGFAVDVVIPLSCISGIFETDALLPSYLMAGARIELRLKSLAEALVAGDGLKANDKALGAVFDIESPKLVLETVTLTDATLRAISMTSATSGLELPFVQVHQTEAQMTADNTNVQINRGLSRANMIVARPHYGYTPAITPLVDSVQALVDLPDKVTGFQVKLGAEFMPSRRVDKAIRLWQQLQVAFGAFKSDYGHSIDYYSYLYGLGFLGQTLEKSSTLAQSGSPISASRDLNMVIETTNVPPANDAAIPSEVDPNITDQRVDVWVPHVALATVFLDSVLIRN